MDTTLPQESLLTDRHYYDIAFEIYTQFQVGMSTSIVGEVGKDVLRTIEELDKKENIEKDGRRRRKKPANSIGGYLAQKIFRYKVDIIPDPAGGPVGAKKTTIWRLQ